MTTIASQCMTCVHRREDFTCDAFPEGIPENVLLTKRDHRDAIRGDNGVRWEPRDETDDHPLGAPATDTIPKPGHHPKRFQDWDENAIEFVQRTHVVEE